MATKRALEDEEPPTKRLRTESNGFAKSVGSTQQDQERAVGITVFVSPGAPGFECTVKQRYTDFLVNEILPRGEVLHLTNSRQKPDFRTKSPPEAGNGAQVEEVAEMQSSRAQAPDVNASVKAEPEAINGIHDEVSSRAQQTQPPAPEAGNDVGENADVPEVSSEDKSALEDIFGEGVTQKIMNLYAAVIRNPRRKPRDHSTVATEAISEKAKRTEVHMVIRRIFSSKLQTETLQDQPGVIAIKAASPKGASGGRGQHEGGPTGAPAKGKIGWQELGGEYLHFTLYKENKDTMEVLSFIASQLKIPAKNFEFAGTKDRRAVTVQKVAVFRMRAERVAGLNRMARGWRAGGFEYKKQGLELGELAGNEFILTLRNCHFPAEEGMVATKRLELAEMVISETAESFKTKGFLNYYGLQRFGSFTTGTHITGMLMLQGDLEGAVDSILTYSSDLLSENVSKDAMSRTPQDDISRADAIRKWREGSITGLEARDIMPRRFSAETAIMQYLSKKDKRSGKLVQDADWQGALMQIQRGLRLMYVHAYQSLVWNMVAGKRWELYGDQVVEGDLVVVGEKDGVGSGGIKAEVDEDGEPIVKPAAEDSLAAKDAFTRARPLSEDEAGSGKYDIFDVVLPQPGFDVLYPANEVGRYYEEFMGSDAGGRLDPHKMRRSWKDVSLSGSYRKMMARPLNGIVECQLKAYEGAEEQLVETDLGKLKKAEANGYGPNATLDESVGQAAEDVGLLKEGSGAERAKSNIAVVMKFQLGSSQYATMALRELTKGGAKAYKPEFNTAR